MTDYGETVVVTGAPAGNAGAVAASILRMRGHLLDLIFQSPWVTTAFPTEVELKEVRERVARDLPHRVPDIMRVTRRARTLFDAAKAEAEGLVPASDAGFRREITNIQRAMTTVGSAVLPLGIQVILARLGVHDSHSAVAVAVMLAVVIAVLAMTTMFTRPLRHPLIRGGGHGRRILETRLPTGLVGAAVAWLLLINWPRVGSWGMPLVVGLVVLLIALGSAWLWVARAARRAVRKTWDSDFPEDWPVATSAAGAAAHVAAQHARAAWIRALANDGMRVVIGDELDRLQPSFRTWLDESQPTRLLNEITESAQLVDTIASRQLAKAIARSTTVSIGISGPRGVGKSALLASVGDERLRRLPSALSILISAPTNYDPREFLVDLFAEVCHRVIGQRDSRTGTTRRPDGRTLSAVLTAAGLSTMLTAALWPWPLTVIRSVAAQPRVIAVSAGVAVFAVGVALHLRGRRRAQPTEAPIVIRAREHLRLLRFLQTQTTEWSGTIKAPAWAQASAKKSVQQMEAALTYPELVRAFRAFVEQVGLQAQVDAGRIHHTTICIDELDKIGSAEDAERFLNGIKAIFGVANCHYLVSISEDAIASFERRALTVRTAFDSAFDLVIAVPRLDLDETRHLLNRRLMRLPEPFLALCHCLSAGLPRDVMRVVCNLLDAHETALATQVAQRAEREKHARRHESTAGYPDRRIDSVAPEAIRVPLDRLAAELIELDIRSVTDGQLSVLRRLSGTLVDSALSWIGRVTARPLTTDELLRWCQEKCDFDDAGDGKADPEAADVVRLLRQYRAYLYYAATTMEAFCVLGDRISAAMELEESRLDLLASARAHLATDYTASWRLVEEFRAASGLAVIGGWPS